MNYLGTRVGVITAQSPQRRYCARCGCELSYSARAVTPMCRDCRHGDPSYLLIAKIAERRDNA